MIASLTQRLPRIFTRSWAPPYLLRVLVFLAVLHHRRWQPFIAAVFSRANRAKALRLGMAVMYGTVAILAVWAVVWSVILSTALSYTQNEPKEWRAYLLTYVPWLRFLIGVVAGVVIAALVEALSYTRDWWRIPMVISGLFWGLLSWKFYFVTVAFAWIGQQVLQPALMLASLTLALF